jgi:hypothetical protein
VNSESQVCQEEDQNSNSHILKRRSRVRPEIYQNGKWDRSQLDHLDSIGILSVEKPY